MTEPLLQASDLSVSFGGVAALSNIELRVGAGSIHGLIGPNGAGKTTLLNCISRLVAPRAGTLRFAGTDLLALHAWQIAGAGIARTFQNFGLVPALSVLDNVMAGMHSVHPGTLFDELIHLRRRNRNEAAMRRRAMETLALLGLESVARQPVSSLAYGIRKSVELARATACKPRLLLLDEPTAGLSRSDMDALRQSLTTIRAGSDVTILVITHHIEFLLAIADEITVLDLGKTIAQGHPSLVRSDPAVIRAYVGTDD
jgi:branched-chain amino acid transport system ATP-binding protein